MGLIIPIEYRPIKGPLIFLAGPIQGTSDWRSCAIDTITALRPNIEIASPLAYENSLIPQNEQANWEMYHLNRAGLYGATFFWLANETEHNCSRAYAQTTRFELGEWKAKSKLMNMTIIVGMDTDFSGGWYIRQRLERSFPDQQIYSTLEETCKGAVEAIKNFSSAHLVKSIMRSALYERKHLPENVRLKQKPPTHTEESERKA